MDYTGRILDEGGAVINLMTFVAPGTTDHTTALQNAINAAASVRGTVLIPPGAYTVSNIILQPGITISGYGATINKSVSPGRLFQLQERTENGQLPTWGGSADSAPLTIEGLTLNGNSPQQVGYRTYGIDPGDPDRYVQQYHMIFLAADPLQAGRLRVVLRDLVIRNGVADGISLYNNVDAQIINCRVSDCWRAGLAITGGYTRCQIQNLVTTGEIDPTGIDVEVDGPGYGNSLRVDITVDGMRLDARFDVNVTHGSTFLAKNVHAGANFELTAYDAIVRISNSSFVVASRVAGTHVNEIIHPTDVTLKNCTFTVQEFTDSAAARELAGVFVTWNVGNTSYGNMRLRLLDCTWRVGAHVKAGDLVRAVQTAPDTVNLDNRLLVRGGTIEAGFDTGFHMEQGGRWVIKGVEIGAARAFFWNGLVRTEQVPNPNGGTTEVQILTTADMRIERVGLRGVTQYMHVGNMDAQNVIDHRDVVLTAAQNVLDDTYGLGLNQYRGSRTILLSGPPSLTNPVPGLTGDMARLAVPQPGQVYEWVCTQYDRTSATWKAVSSLAA